MTEADMGLRVGVTRCLFLFAVLLVLPAIVASQPLLPPPSPLLQENEVPGESSDGMYDPQEITRDPLSADTQASECHVYDAQQPVREGWGAAYDVFSAEQEVLLKATCTPNETQITVGNNNADTYIYHLAHYWINEQEDGDKELQCNGEKLDNTWCVGEATGVISSQIVYFAAYTCRQIDGSWKCGCRDSQCAQSFWQLQAVGSPDPSMCPVESIQVDTSLSNDVVSGKVSGLSPCDSVLEIHNKRGYWVNFEWITVGTVSISPAGDANNLYDFNKVIPPNDSVQYLVRFTSVGQSVSAFLDVTNATGEGARIMNMTQLLVDYISLQVLGFGFGFKLGVQLLPDLVLAFDAMPNLSNAVDALFQNPPDIGTFREEVVNAANAGEFVRLGETLENLGLEAAREGFQILSGDLGQALGILEIIVRNWLNNFDLLFGYPAGSVSFVAE